MSKIITVFAAALLPPWPALAAAAGGTSVDLTPIAVALVGGVFSVILAVATGLVNSHLKDAAARDVVDRALQNALGAVQQAAQGAVAAEAPSLPGVPAALLPGVQYVLDHAGDEAARLGVTPDKIADKISARIGLVGIQHNLALTASSSKDQPPPLSAVALFGTPPSTRS